MAPNFLIIGLTAFIPFLIGFVWYHPVLFGGERWRDLAGLTEEQHSKNIKGWQMALTILLNFFFAIGMYTLVVHPAGAFQMVGGDLALLGSGTAKAFLDEYAHNHLSFGHGALHGFGATIMFALPLFSYVTIFDRKSGKYLLVRMGFWILNGILMGGVLCKWGWTSVL